MLSRGHSGTARRAGPGIQNIGISCFSGFRARAFGAPRNDAVAFSAAWSAVSWSGCHRAEPRFGAAPSGRGLRAVRCFGGLAEAAGADGRRPRARRGQRHHGTHRRAEAHRTARPADDRREQAGSGRHDRRRHGRPRHARRIHAAGLSVRLDGDQPVGLFEAALRSADELRADRQHGDLSSRPVGERDAADQVGGRTRRLGQGQPGQGQLRLDVRGVPAHDGAVQPEDRREISAHSVQERGRARHPRC